jgi:dTDP-4-dehydrorhamnose reductase
MKDKVLILGSDGLLGFNLKKYFKFKKVKFIIYKRKKEVNFKDLRNLILKNKINIIINLRALTNVDFCEKNKRLANKINYIFVKNLCILLKKIKSIHLIQISTDQLYSKFSQNYENNYSILNHYAKTKVLAEQSAKNVSSTIFRTNFFGHGKHKKKESFSDWIYNNLKKRKKIRMATDIFFNPVRISTLCNIIYLACKLKIPGIYNLGSKRGFSKYLFSKKLASFLNLNKSLIIKVKKKELNFYAKRPSDMRMQLGKLEKDFNLTLPSLNDEIEVEAKNYLNA